MITGARFARCVLRRVRPVMVDRHWTVLPVLQAILLSAPPVEPQLSPATTTTIQGTASTPAPIPHTLHLPFVPHASTTASPAYHPLSALLAFPLSIFYPMVPVSALAPLLLTHITSNVWPVLRVAALASTDPHWFVSPAQPLTILTPTSNVSEIAQQTKPT